MRTPRPLDPPPKSAQKRIRSAAILSLHPGAMRRIHLLGGVCSVTNSYTSRSSEMPRRSTATSSLARRTARRNVKRIPSLCTAAARHRVRTYQSCDAKRAAVAQARVHLIATARPAALRPGAPVPACGYRPRGVASVATTRPMNPRPLRNSYRAG